MEYGLFDNIVAVGDEIVNAQWIEWYHWGVPNTMGDERENAQIRLAIWFHCRNCTALDGCYFNVLNMPKYPAHDNCDCEVLPIPKEKALQKLDATCQIEKFSNYIFGEQGKENGKFGLFTEWGYTNQDIVKLSSEFSRQGLEKYFKGEYKLKKKSEYGQQIAIVIDLNGRQFYSGWIVEPEGKIRLVTPFAGRI